MSIFTLTSKSKDMLVIWMFQLPVSIHALIGEIIRIPRKDWQANQHHHCETPLLALLIVFSQKGWDCKLKWLEYTVETKNMNGYHLSSLDYHHFPFISLHFGKWCLFSKDGEPCCFREEGLYAICENGNCKVMTTQTAMRNTDVWFGVLSSSAR